jgi:hypothetical protein
LRDFLKLFNNSKKARSSASGSPGGGLVGVKAFGVKVGSKSGVVLRVGGIGTLVIFTIAMVVIGLVGVGRLDILDVSTVIVGVGNIISASVGVGNGLVGGWSVGKGVASCPQATEQSISIINRFMVTTISLVFFIFSPWNN